MRATFSITGAMTAALLLALIAGACGQKATTLEELTSTDVTFPNGVKIVCETMRQEFELTRGLMFRDSLPANRGMLFEYPTVESHQHWTYQVKFPIDTIWMDRDRRIVEIVANMAPCDGKAAHECPQYGGVRPSRYAVEVNAGVAAKNGLKVGDRLDF
jgi:uncharacterized membrane protein (UPF0127 family)